MSNLFFLIFLLALIGLPIGLVWPGLFRGLVKKVPNRKTIALVFSLLLVFSFVGIGITAPHKESSGSSTLIQTPGQNENIDSVLSDEIAVEELNALAEDAPEAVTNINGIENVEDSHYQYYTVTGIVDGDTFKVNIDGKTETLRMIGIDTPETVDPRKPVQCFGVEASNKAKALLAGKKVRLEGDPTQGERDKYDRLLRYAWLEDGAFFNKLMISEGYAYEYTYSIPYKYQFEFKQAESDAKSSKRGLWADRACVTASAPASSPITTPTPATLPSSPGSNCDPNYSGCVPIASDVDCAGGSGNGPAYVQGPINVIGVDIYKLDSDHDGVACE